MTPAVGLALGLAAALFWGLTDITATITSRRVGTLLAAAGMQVAATAIVVCCSWRAASRCRAGGRRGQVIAVGALSAVGYLATYQAFRLGPLSVVSPVMSAYGGLTVILAVIVLGETLTGTQAAGAIVATLGVIMAGVVFERDIRRRGSSAGASSSPSSPCSCGAGSRSSSPVRSGRRGGCRSSRSPGR